MMNIWVCRECLQLVFHGCCSIHKKNPVEMMAVPFGTGPHLGSSS